MGVVQDAHVAAENFFQRRFQIICWIQTVCQIRDEKPKNVRQDRNAGHDGYVGDPARPECPFRKRFENVRAVLHRPPHDE